MGLSQQQFAQIRRALSLQGASMEDPTGKRRAARWSVQAIVAFAPCQQRVTAGDPAGDASAARWVTLLDVSATGASILSKAQLAPGEFFVLALPAEGEAHFATVCRVQHSRVKLDGTFRVGAQFCDPQAPGAENVTAAVASLRAMGLFVTDPADGAATPPPQTQRRSERHQAEGRALIHAYDDMGEPGPVEEVPALDFSETGVCIFRREPMRVGDYFMARVPLLNAPPIISLCRVTNVARCQGENRYRIGAEFTRFPGLTRRVVSTVLKLFFRAA